MVTNGRRSYMSCSPLVFCVGRMSKLEFRRVKQVKILSASSWQPLDIFSE